MLGFLSHGFIVRAKVSANQLPDIDLTQAWLVRSIEQLYNILALLSAVDPTS